jgi:hypothetical protein
VTQILKRLLLIALLALPVAAWAFIKPLRVLAPEFAGVTCFGKVCVDDAAHLSEAKALSEEAVLFVQSSVGELQVVPRMVFCSTKECSRSFGFGSNGAYNVGTLGLVISHRGWHSYFVRHELIHHLQNERLGSLNAWLHKPDWFKEGMAYSLSEDPRMPLPEPLEGYRAQFESWFKLVGVEHLWAEAELL